MAPSPARLVTWSLVAAVACIDLSPLRVYRYLLVSDVLLMFAVTTETIACGNRRVYTPTFVTLVFLLYAISTGAAFYRPLEPELGVYTWLHSAFLMLAYVPCVT